MYEIDLIYTSHVADKSLSAMSVMLFHPSDKSKDKMLGPVNATSAIKALAPLLHEHAPDQFADVKAAEDRLMFIHFKNMTDSKNSMGVPYPSYCQSTHNRNHVNHEIT